MRVSNEPGAGGTGAFSELFRLQADFQARLAEETLRYLRRLQGAVVPAAPGTVMMPADGVELRAAAEPGGRAELTLEIENLQRVHCMVTPQLTPLVSAAGVTWFPAAEMATASRLLPPAGVERIAIPVAVPAELPPGEYRGALLLQGFRQSTVPVVLTVGAPTPRTDSSTKSRPSASKAASKKAASKGAASKKAASKRAAPKKAASKKAASKKAATSAPEDESAAAAKRPRRPGRQPR